MFEIFTRTNNTSAWLSYGVFRSEAEWHKELPHIAFLRSMGALYIKRVRL